MTSSFNTRYLSAEPDAIAPDGSNVRLLCALNGGSMAHFELARGMTSIAVTHRTVAEVWFVLSGGGEMWRKLNEREEVTPLEAGVSLTIPRGTHFQFRTTSREALTAIGVTMPPWPGADEAIAVEGKWAPTVKRDG